MFDFLILCEHGAGIGALNAYMQKSGSLNICKIPSRLLILPEIESFYNEKDDKKKGILIDSYKFTQDAVQKFILDNVKKNYLLISLFRDPLERYKSVINNHINRFSNCASGCWDLGINQTLLYANGDIDNLCMQMCTIPNMNTLSYISDSFTKNTDNQLLISMTDILPQTVGKTLKYICDLLNVHLSDDFNSFQSRMFSKENNFIYWIKKLVIHKKNNTFQIMGFPIEFMQFFPEKRKNLVYESAPEECGFKIDDFTGNIGFVLVGQYSEAAKQKCIEILHDDPEIIKLYCKDVSLRYIFAKKIYANLKINDESLIELSKINHYFNSSMQKYLNRHIKYANEYSYIKYSNPVINKETYDLLSRF